MEIWLGICLQDPPKAISLQHKLIKNTVQKFMSHTIFIYASIVLVVLIILGVVFTIITMRRLHSTQKQLQKQDKASTKEKKYDWYEH